MSRKKSAIYSPIILIVCFVIFIALGFALYYSAQLINQNTDQRSYADSTTMERIAGPFQVRVALKNPTASTAQYNLILDGKGLGAKKTLPAGQTVVQTYTTPTLPVSIKADSGTIEFLGFDIQNTVGEVLLRQGPFSVMLTPTHQSYVLTISIPRTPIPSTKPIPTTPPLPTTKPTTTSIPRSTLKPITTAPPAVHTTNSVIENGGFELGSLSGWSKEDCCSYSHRIVTSPTREGSYALESVLNESDPIVALSKRSELKLPKVEPESEYWYGVSIFIPSDWVIDTTPEIVTQWHSEPDFDLGEDWRNPPLAILIDGDHWRIVNHWDKEKVTLSEQYDGSVTYLPGKIQKGVWTDWKVHAKWRSSSVDGKLEIWKDGVLVVDKNGPNTFNDKMGPYFKMGIYKFAWKDPNNKSLVTKRVLYHDNVIVVKGPVGF